MSDVEAIRSLLSEYALALDAGDFDGALQLFAADGEFQVYGQTFKGLDDIGAMFRAAPHGLHLTGASRLEIAHDTARARSQVLFVNAVTQQLRSALYDDELVRHDGRWLFGRRRCRFVTGTGLSDTPEAP
ncbi:nuclear transport factor 2 family protein [Mycobacterium asiaticum]|uniref:nuclear transport factor 2 family protein n=1 Tax=Mycobacterium asiaticum TaxID=1790 RepID=UPI00055E89F2|nr:nuclear transport factor 2 family protein [Mycobacterium asiaticum]ORA16411.1 hypothetical protein BST16_06830 [Mycobacterium asiaticum DSM 44297]